MATDSFVGLPTDGTGKKAATVEKTDSSSNTVEIQQVTVADPNTDGQYQAVSTEGAAIVGALVSDTPEAYLLNEKHALSMTSDGRLRVASVEGDVQRVWQSWGSNPYDTDLQMTAEVDYV